MGYDYSVRYMDMSSQENATEVTTVLDWAQERGKTVVVKEKVVINVVRYEDRVCHHHQDVPRYPGRSVFQVRTR